MVSGSPMCSTNSPTPCSRAAVKARLASSRRGVQIKRATVAAAKLKCQNLSRLMPLTA